MATGPVPPATIGRYQIKSELGRGAMGIVYRGFDPTIGRSVAIKTVLVDAGDPELIKRFRQEAQAAGVLSHPNIVTIYDAGEDQGLFYIAMELVEGQTLQQVLQKGSLPFAHALSIAKQVGAALDHAHARNIIHRDVKPANIVLSGGIAKVMDFGVAKVAASGLTTTGQVFGTPAYMSPELVKGAPIDGRSDVFSLGVVLYEMVTGSKPFTGENITTVIFKIVGEEPPPPCQINPALDPALDQIVRRVLAKSALERYQTCAELAADLERVPASSGLAQAAAAGAGSVAPTILVDRNSVGHTPRPGALPISGGKRARVGLGVVAVLAVLGAAAALWKATRPFSEVQSERIVVPNTAAPSQPAPAALPKAEQKQSVEVGQNGPAEVKVQLAPIEAQVAIATNPPGADVMLDGKKLGTTPGRFRFPYGEHRVALRKDGFQSVERDLNIGDKAPPPAVLVTLIPRTRQPTAATARQAGRVLVRTRPEGASILVDGQKTDYRTPVNMPVPAGKHKITVQRDGFKSETQEVQVRPLLTFTLDLVLTPDGSKRRRFPFLRR